MILTLPYLTSGVDKLLHLPSAEAVSARPKARHTKYDNLTTILLLLEKADVVLSEQTVLCRRGRIAATPAMCR